MYRPAFISAVFLTEIVMIIVGLEKTFLLRICETVCASSGQCQISPTQDPRCYVTNTSGISGASSMRPPPRLSSRLGIPESKTEVGVKIMEFCLQQWPKLELGHEYLKLRAGEKIIQVKLHEENETWSAARRVCRSEGGDLVKLDTRKKDLAIKEKFYKRKATGLSMWIGLFRLGKGKIFRWPDGTRLEYSHWHLGEPSHHDKKMRLENCVEVVDRKVFGVRWNDENCGSKRAFLCERPQPA